ncbi:PEP-CTERM sorting domain-containing protein [Luteolibacter sp. SL250]|uniref:PEP-CTERM sorting domain-containing protein n=1 Tax=Luteolibacter sp. SL250 TaxID=2995170 RepID=UPI00226F7CC0|nr:PEP-CTERM sorting domain-containing protein [Luteolibacter sp. SL250]WAC18479.1 PEP-CTERM sorting domain-containing protein [Luteolibacter sp. SL250]
MKKALILLLAAVANAGASTILIDFGTTNTTGTPSYWNNFNILTDEASFPLFDTSGPGPGNTTYFLSLSGGAILNVPDNPTTVATTYNPFTPTTVLSDAVYQTAPRTFTLSGLLPNVAYTITFFSYVSRDSPRDTVVSIPGQTSMTLRASGDPTAAFSSGGDIATTQPIVPGVGGTIPITVTNLNGSWILSGMEITYAVPEPATAVLSALGLIPLLRRRR